MPHPPRTSDTSLLSICCRCLRETHSSASSFVYGWHHGIVSPHPGPSFRAEVLFAPPVAPNERDFASMCIYDAVVSDQLSTTASRVVTASLSELNRAPRPRPQTSVDRFSAVLCLPTEWRPGCSRF
ncbi:unnamed protein product [Penicillium salamii]|nr:unnamed protein product [Penicillium salamii]CAG7954097.1 unnamed protein product [Penicillium salamii]CAG8007295.1 unnamed protein product [Penicillium salamii]CAG8316570.1 unnamed protein product [Penicillium salamii]CAG8352692.1 unnamed protein product [Penicillium salamii]